MLYILVDVDKVNINYGYHGNNTQNPHKINIANWTFKLKKKNATVLVIYPTSLLTCMVTCLLRVHLYYIRDAEFTLAHEIWWKYFHRNRWSGCLNFWCWSFPVSSQPRNQNWRKIHLTTQDSNMVSYS